MVLGKAVDRIRYGPVVENGYFWVQRDEYRERIQDMDYVDVEVEGWFDPASYSTSPASAKRKISQTGEENLTGEEAWDFVNLALEEMTVENEGLDEIPFYFEHRSRNGDEFIRINAESKSLLGSKREYSATFESR